MDVKLPRNPGLVDDQAVYYEVQQLGKLSESRSLRIHGRGLNTNPNLTVLLAQRKQWQGNLQRHGDATSFLKWLQSGAALSHSQRIHRDFSGFPMDLELK